MKSTIFTLVFITIATLVFAQEAPSKPVKENITTTEGKFSIVEKMPEFPGGSKKMIEFIEQNIKHPTTVKENERITGKCFTSFIVNTDGSISDAKILRGMTGANGAEYDKEALQLIKSMPKWNPGTQDGKPVATSFNLPITFK